MSVVANFKLGDLVEVTIDGMRYGGVISIYGYSKFLSEKTDTLRLGPNLFRYVKQNDYRLVILPNIYGYGIATDRSTLKSFGNYIVLPININDIEVKSTPTGEVIHELYFTDSSTIYKGNPE